MRRYRSRSVAAAGALSALGLASTAAGQTGQPTPVPADLFRKPAGPYAIGTRDYLWIDESRGEPPTKDPSDKRHLMVQIWYPAESVSGAEPAPTSGIRRSSGSSPASSRCCTSGPTR